MFVLDTDHISVLERADSGERARLIHRLDHAGVQMLVTTVVTYEEQTRGWLAYVATAKTMAREVMAYRRLWLHLETYRRLVVLEYDPPAAEHFRRLQSARIKIGTFDLRIASIALANGAILLSRNLKDFEKIPDLNVENWLD